MPYSIYKNGNSCIFLVIIGQLNSCKVKANTSPYDLSHYGRSLQWTLIKNQNLIYYKVLFTLDVGY